jgi:restriction endonuclease S subunit
MWEKVKLNEVAKWARGLTYSKNDEVESDGIAVLRATNIDLATHSIILDDIRYISEAVKVQDDKYAKVGDLLVCTASGSKSHVGKVAIVEEDLGMTFGGFMAALRCNERCIPRFLYHVLTSPDFKRHLASLGDGANINNLKFSQIESYELLLPPLAEQQRIVAKLDGAFVEIDRAIDLTRQREASLISFKGSLLSSELRE